MTAWAVRVAACDVAKIGVPERTFNEIIGMSGHATVAAIYRYPVKGLSPDPLTRAPLARGETLPADEV